MCCFSAKHTALTTKSKYWLARNQDVTSGAKQYYKYPAKRVGLVQNRPRHHRVEKIVILAFKQQSLTHNIYIHPGHPGGRSINKQSTSRLRSSQVITDRRPALSEVTIIYGLLLISIKILGKVYSIQLVSDLSKTGPS